MGQGGDATDRRVGCARFEERVKEGEEPVTTIRRGRVGGGRPAAINGDRGRRSADAVWTETERTPPEIWPDSTPWQDAYGSFGTLPDPEGWGANVSRVRVPPFGLPAFWQDLEHRYGSRWPRFTVGPRDTPGIREWLRARGYVRAMEMAVCVLPREAWPLA